MALMCAGLIAIVVALMLGEVGGSGGINLEPMFYAGIAMCVVGAALFAIRVALARRRS
jgi:hypothetical protein